MSGASGMSRFRSGLGSQMNRALPDLYRRFEGLTASDQAIARALTGVALGTRDWAELYAMRASNSKRRWADHRRREGEPAARVPVALRSRELQLALQSPVAASKKTSTTGTQASTLLQWADHARACQRNSSSIRSRRPSPSLSFAGAPHWALASREGSGCWQWRTGRRSVGCTGRTRRRSR